jgi:hypothetical protein
VECCAKAEAAIKELLLKGGVNLDEISPPVVQKAGGKTKDSADEAPVAVAAPKNAHVVCC